MDLSSSSSGTSTCDIPLLAVPTAVSRAPVLSCMDLVMAGLFHHPAEIRLLLPLTPNLGLGRSVTVMHRSWKETMEKAGHEVSQHLKTQWNPQECLHSGRWGNREDITSVHGCTNRLEELAGRTTCCCKGPKRTQLGFI